MFEIKLKSNISNLKIPLTLSKNEECKFLPLFRGMTAGLLEISCHMSTHAKDHCPHSPHIHDEEEILFLLSGSISLIHPNSNDLIKRENMFLKEGQFLYYPAHFSHTFIATSDIPTNCLSLKWKTNSKNKNSGLSFAYYSLPDNLEDQTSNKLISKTLFEASTLYLQKLHCHTSVIKPGGGVNTHSDLYDIVTIILKGEVETLGKECTPYDVIFYETGSPHEIFNRKDNSAKEIVFEFHTNKVILINKIPYLLNYYFHELTNLKLWKRKLKKILKRILPENVIKTLKKISNRA